jgi:hypothetical protein
MGGQIPEFLKHINTALAVPITIPYGKIELNLFLRKDELAS